MIGSPMRSFTDPPGLKNSALPYTGVTIPLVTRVRRISGVQPIVWRTLSYGRRCRSCSVMKGSSGVVGASELFCFTLYISVYICVYLWRIVVVRLLYHTT